jgi:hypothetical protein
MSVILRPYQVRGLDAARANFRRALWRETTRAMEATS